MVVEDVRRDEMHEEPSDGHCNDHVVELADQRDEVGQEVDREREVQEEGRREETGEQRNSGILDQSYEAGEDGPPAEPEESPQERPDEPVIPQGEHQGNQDDEDGRADEEEPKHRHLPRPRWTEVSGYRVGGRAAVLRLSSRRNRF